jgi:hypothetical protein
MKWKEGKGGEGRGTEEGEGLGNIEVRTWGSQQGNSREFY